MGTVTEFNYCFSLANLQSSLVQLKTLADSPSSWGFLSNKNAFVFVNNHDNQRGHGGGGGIVTFDDPHGLKVTTGMLMALPYGTKRVMSSYFFTDTDAGPPPTQPSTADSDSGECTNGWVCEHRWPGIRNLGMLGGAMNKAPGYENWWDNGSSQLSFSRGEGFFVINNDGWELNGGVQTGLPAGSYCNLATNDLAGCTDVINVDANGFACVAIDAGANIPFAYTILDAKVAEYGEINECNDLASGPISECYDCNCPSNKKLDCGMMGVTETQCAGKGCAWCPSDKAGDPWCFWLAEDALPPSTTDGPGGPTDGPTDGPGGLVCPPAEEHRECGFMGETQAHCEATGCLWCPTWDGGPAWCTFGAEASSTQAPATTTSSGSATSSGSTTNGGGTGSSTTPSAGGGGGACLPTQFCPPAAMCNIIDVADREDCGELASTPETCVASGCCWEEQPPGPIDGIEGGAWPPWCYHPSTGPAPTGTAPGTTQSTAGNTGSTPSATTQSAASTPSSTLATTVSTINGGGGSGNTTLPAGNAPCDGDCCPTQLCPEAEVCNIPEIGERLDCGELASTPTTCVASGCCWEEQPPGPIDGIEGGPWPPWCYYPVA